MTQPASRPFELKGPHVLAALVLFFGAVIAVDVSMAVAAYRTFPGEVSATPFEDGLQFNRTLARRAEERSLGWRARVFATVMGAGSDVRSGRVLLRVAIADARGQPVTGLKLAGQLERPATEIGRVSPNFTETKPGVYESAVPDTPGAWDLTLNGSDRAGRAFEAESLLTWR